MRNRIIYTWLSAAVAVIFSPAVHAQVYKCGNSYSQHPCGPDAKQVDVPMRSGESGSASQIVADIKKKLSEPVPDVPPSADVIEANKKLCEKLTRERMKDPEAAKITGVHRLGARMQYENGRYYPGVSYTLTVNGKNSYGAYTGNKLHACVFSMDEKTIVRLHQIEH